MFSLEGALQALTQVTLGFDSDYSNVEQSPPHYNNLLLGLAKE